MRADDDLVLLSKTNERTVGEGVGHGLLGFLCFAELVWTLWCCSLSVTGRATVFIDLLNALSSVASTTSTMALPWETASVISGLTGVFLAQLTWMLAEFDEALSIRLSKFLLIRRPRSQFTNPC